MRYRVLGIMIGAGAALGGAVTLVGWYTATPRLADWHNDGIAMQPNTAVASIACGLAVLILSLPLTMRPHAVTWLGRIAATTAAIIGGLTLLQHLLGWDFRIDRILIDPQWGEYATVSPGRMGPPASWSFLLLGIGLLLATRRQGSLARRLAAAIGLVAIVPSIISWTAYLYAADPLYSLPHLTGIARQSAMILFALSVGLLLAVHEFGLGALVRRNDSAGTLIRVLLPISIALMLFTGWLEDYGVSKGLYDSSLGNAALTVVRIIMFVALLWGTAATIGRQIEHRDRAEAALRSSEQRFRLLADAAPVLIWMSGVDKLCTWFNKQWLDFVGRPMEQELGNGWADNVHPEDFDRCLNTYVTAFDARRPFEMMYRLRRYDGEYRWMLDHGIPLHHADGTFTGYIGSCIDFTERKLMEDSLLERRSDLEHQVEQQTAELTRAQQQMLLNSRMAAVGTLAAGLSHDITNLLLPLGMRVHSLEASDRVPHEVRSELTIITTLLDHLRKLSKNLALFWRNPEETDARGVTDLAKWVADVHRLLDASIGSEIAIRWNVPDDLPPVSIASHRLTQAVQNLIHNARDAVIAGRAGVSAAPRSSREDADITVHAVPHPTNATVLLSVTDRGMGMSETVKARCLDPFFSTKGAHRPTGGGSGLGLSLAFQLISDAGGSLHIDSTPGAGTTITLTLPVARTPQIETIERKLDGILPRAIGQSTARGAASHSRAG